MTNAFYKTTALASLMEIKRDSQLYVSKKHDFQVLIFLKLISRKFECIQNYVLQMQFKLLNRKKYAVC